MIMTAPRPVLEAMAVALYDTDEDILDQAILFRWAISGFKPKNVSERLPWDMMSQPIQDAYRRRAAAALSALTYGTKPGETVVFKFGGSSFSITDLG